VFVDDVAAIQQQECVQMVAVLVDIARRNPFESDQCRNTTVLEYL